MKNLKIFYLIFMKNMEDGESELNPGLSITVNTNSALCPLARNQIHRIKARPIKKANISVNSKPYSKRLLGLRSNVSFYEMLVKTPQFVVKDDPISPTRHTVKISFIKFSKIVLALSFSVYLSIF